MHAFRSDRAAIPTRGGERERHELSDDDPQLLSGGISDRDDNGQSGIFELDAETTATVSANLLVTSGGSVASVEVFLAGSTTTHCESRVVGIPTG
jgi:hypothetical protein